MEWFDVDKAGLAAILERRGKAFAIFELVQNAWDALATRVEISLEPIAGQPYATLSVVDDAAEPWADLGAAYTMFGRSRRAADAEKRGRFCLGDKLVLSLCRKAEIVTSRGSIYFNADGTRKQSGNARPRGTAFTCDIRMTREELADVEDQVGRLISPGGFSNVTTYNGKPIERPAEIKTFEVRLPTEIADGDGILRRGVRTAFVQAFAGEGEILELGIPICSVDWPWRLNVLQKVPLGLERDSVTDAFRRALQVAAVNALAETLDEETAGEAWVSEAIGDSRIDPAALAGVIKQRFGERAVVAVPGDPLANSAAEAAGYQVIHGGALGGSTWANLRKHQTLHTTSTVFPTPRPAPSPINLGGGGGKCCPTCGQPI